MSIEKEQPISCQVSNKDVYTCVTYTLLKAMNVYQRIIGVYGFECCWLMTKVCTNNVPPMYITMVKITVATYRWDEYLT